MNREETQKTLDQFKDFVIAKSKANLASMNKDSSKKLSNSIDGVAKVMPNSFTLDFTMEKYGLYQDKGVSGVKKKYNNVKDQIIDFLKHKDAFWEDQEKF